MEGEKILFFVLNYIIKLHSLTNMKIFAIMFFLLCKDKGEWNELIYIELMFFLLYTLVNYIYWKKKKKNAKYKSTTTNLLFYFYFFSSLVYDKSIKQSKYMLFSFFSPSLIFHIYIFFLFVMLPKYNWKNKTKYRKKNSPQV